MCVDPVLPRISSFNFKVVEHRLCRCMMERCSSSAKGESTTKRNWDELPIDVTENILNRLTTIQILESARNVCRLWWNICKDPLMWRTIDMSDWVFLCSHSYHKLVKICCYAIDLSCGRLEEIAITCFGTDDLLQYIAERASNLRSIWLITCGEISDKGLSEVAKKLPQLEKLHISWSFMYRDSLVSKNSLEAIGRCCPLLKSLEFKGSWWKSQLQCDDEAFAIAKTMPGLRYLNISLNPLTNVGLLAILDGCPLLESLDLRACFHLGLRGSLGKRCCEQIIDLRYGL